MNEKYTLNLDTEGRILSAGLAEVCAGEIVVDTLPDGDITDYVYQNGDYIFQPLAKEETVSAPTIEERLQATEQALLAIMGV